MIDNAALSGSRNKQITLLEGKIPTLKELEQIEESASKSEAPEAKTVLLLSAALREALQAKENAVALAAEFKRIAARKTIL